MPHSEFAVHRVNQMYDNHNIWFTKAYRDDFYDAVVVVICYLCQDIVKRNKDKKTLKQATTKTVFFKQRFLVYM